MPAWDDGGTPRRRAPSSFSRLPVDHWWAAPDAPPGLDDRLRGGSRPDPSDLSVIGSNPSRQNLDRFAFSLQASHAQ
ncbi:hypothetical protein SCOCK_350040 [Actinacidiphila cocklensis]|uniref:Uncharacterized protein n=1 Tax=Actinacidiphila cocklensis TaxID=887465 RepID=A0A9W4GSQ7_9ACTN|nr:hypothetical protein SCOCK_350040 [Actinacidiphila cocklensis]